ncbi:hypothetical protein [Flavobacterium fluviatile]|uniref:hypothetical protein n=1 Tax=Flavobacterium fluviatile TaxID=1862387 RepID=UPI0013D358F6|nr:hypothetical protein [Flavobacterium fluviatile]
MKNITIILMLIICSISRGQNKTEDILVDSNGKVISKSKIKNTEKISSEKTIEMFYKYQNNIEKLSPLISFRFYQKTPYYKFKEILKEKNKSCGKLIEKTLMKSETSTDKKSIGYAYKVTYQNIKTVEEIVLIKESENDNFQVYIYNIKKAKN